MEIEAIDSMHYIDWLCYMRKNVTVSSAFRSELIFQFHCNRYPLFRVIHVFRIFGLNWMESNVHTAHGIFHPSIDKSSILLITKMAIV